MNTQAPNRLYNAVLPSGHVVRCCARLEVAQTYLPPVGGKLVDAETGNEYELPKPAPVQTLNAVVSPCEPMKTALAPATPLPLLKAIPPDSQSDEPSRSFEHTWRDRRIPFLQQRSVTWQDIIRVAHRSLEMFSQQQLGGQS